MDDIEFAVRVAVRLAVSMPATIDLRQDGASDGQAIDLEVTGTPHDFGPIRTKYGRELMAGPAVAQHHIAMKIFLLRPITQFTHSIAIIFPLLVGLPLLEGCAGTRVSDVRKAASVRSAAPKTLAIIVTDSSPVPKRSGMIARHAKDVKYTIDALTGRLNELFAKHRLQVVDSDWQSGDQILQHADLTLTCTITTVRSGSEAARLLVGYGAGKAVLDVTSTLSAASAPARPLLSFSTRSTTGAMPGAGLGMVSAAGSAGTALHMLGPALGIPGTLQQGLAQETGKTAERIDAQIATFFMTQGWPYRKA